MSEFACEASAYLEGQSGPTRLCLCVCVCAREKATYSTNAAGGRLRDYFVWHPTGPSALFELLALRKSALMLDGWE